MEQLEDSTIDLIYRRRVHSYFSGYVIIILITVLVITLPLVKVDVVTSVKGMVRPENEPLELFSSITGVIDNCILEDNLEVGKGDTLVWLRTGLPDAKIKAILKQIRIHNASLEDIILILQGGKPCKTSHFQQSYGFHLAAIAHLKIRKDFLMSEFNTCETLYQEEVISRYEYEKSRSDYQLVCAEETDLKENYRNSLEGELYRIQKEIRGMQDEIKLIQSTFQDYYIVAPDSGILYNCLGFSSGLVIHPVTPLGMLSPAGKLVAECYLNPGKMISIRAGTQVKLRFDDAGFRSHHPLETEVEMIDQAVTRINGNPACRIRCKLQQPQIHCTNGSIEALRNGMTFTASFILFRRSLAALLLEKANLWVNPSQSVKRDDKKT